MEEFAKAKYGAVVYKKKQILDDLAIFVAHDYIYDCTIDSEGTSIFYPKKSQAIYRLDDFEALVTGQKYGFVDPIPLEILKEEYDTEDEMDALRQYFEEERQILRFLHFDLNKEEVTIKEVGLDKLKNATIAPEDWDFVLKFYDGLEEEPDVVLTHDTVVALINDLKKRKTRNTIDFFERALEEAKGDPELEKQFEEKEKEKKVNIESKTTEELNKLIGLTNIKEEVNSFQNYLLFREKTKGSIKLDAPNINMAFYGNPGTGKTTVARVIARILYELGYVRNSNILECTARDFIAEYVGQTAEKARELLDKGRGSVIFIDEAYVFASRGQEYAYEALVEIIKEMEKRNSVFIFAGYTDEMKQFIDMNPGIKSRIGYHLPFKDYTLDELYQIFEYKINNIGLKLGDGMEERIKAIISHFNKTNKFGNGRFVDNLVNKIIMNHADRTKEITDIEILTTLECIDCDEDFEKRIGKEKDKEMEFIIKGFGGI